LSLIHTATITISVVTPVPTEIAKIFTYPRRDRDRFLKTLQSV
jgi:hypothetical protein